MTSINKQNEHDSISKVLYFQLHHAFKKVGYLMAVSIFAFLIAYKFVGDNTLIVKDVLRTLLLLFLFVTTLSKDKVEDEYIKHVRFQSFLISFVLTIAYSILIPLIAIILDFAIVNITGDGSVGFYERSAFEVMFTMLGIQLLSFETLKRFVCAE